MSMVPLTESLFNFKLNAAGFIGRWKFDHSTQNFSGDGLMHEYLRVSRASMAKGVHISYVDAIINSRSKNFIQSTTSMMPNCSNRYYFEFFARGQEGCVRKLRSYASTMVGMDGFPVLTQGFMTDVTEFDSDYEERLDDKGEVPVKAASSNIRVQHARQLSEECDATTSAPSDAEIVEDTKSIIVDDVFDDAERIREADVDAISAQIYESQGRNVHALAFDFYPRIVFFDRAHTVRTATGKVIVVLVQDAVKMLPGLARTECCPAICLRMTSDGAESLVSAAEEAIDKLCDQEEEV